MWCHSLPYWTCDSCEPFIFPIISYILGGPTDTMAIIRSFVYMCEVTVFGPTFVPGGGNQKQQQAMISWSRLKKNHLSFSQLERCMEIFSSFQWGLKMTHHFNLKGQTSFHQAVKDHTWDFVTVQWAYRQPSSSLAYEWHWQSTLCAFYRWCGIPSKTSGAVVPRLHPHLFATEKTGKHRGRSQLALIGGNILYFGGRNLIGKKLLDALQHICCVSQKLIHITAFMFLLSYSLACFCHGSSQLHRQGFWKTTHQSDANAFLRLEASHPLKR